VWATTCGAGVNTNTTVEVEIFTVKFLSKKHFQLTIALLQWASVLKVKIEAFMVTFYDIMMTVLNSTELYCYHMETHHQMRSGSLYESTLCGSAVYSDHTRV
jgi:hypothetical protein